MQKTTPLQRLLIADLSGGVMNRDCGEGLELRRKFVRSLKLWDWFDPFKASIINSCF